ncbi:unnamed protein product [Vitrella brassicaformis CCMP3155]|uniref:Uncharacterized protein n=1 Tax=Vitrella brassicaformis (strain CCMP3155) TaxID=1169540 RepID=A0A0G4G713_VITBC|nr:unnamed protein product [Vitrella brassicaformis CCMP3155]|eukprot:CEM24008.1 unnamed protein product [Vitrella brassicaformis CCMP3155]
MTSRFGRILQCVLVIAGCTWLVLHVSFLHQLEEPDSAATLTGMSERDSMMRGLQGRLARRAKMAAGWVTGHQKMKSGKGVQQQEQELHEEIPAPQVEGPKELRGDEDQQQQDGDTDDDNDNDDDNDSANDDQDDDNGDKEVNVEEETEYWQSADSVGGIAGAPGQRGYDAAVAGAGVVPAPPLEGDNDDGRHGEGEAQHEQQDDQQQQEQQQPDGGGDGWVYRDVGPGMLHGAVGLLPNGTPAWQPAPSPPQKVDMARELREGGGFFLRKSDSLPLHRDVKDLRQDLCLAKTYDIPTLPRTCVVFVFYNEPFSTLMRSVHSVLDRTPPELLQEIVLVDDGSDKEWIKPREMGGNGMIADYITHLPKTRMVRLEQRKGIVAARLRGVEECEAETFVILDSHIEVEPQWLEPLMERLQGPEGRKRFVMPQIDSIDPETFKFLGGGIGCTLGFLWKLMEHAYPDQKKDLAKRKSAIDPMPSPAMAGGLFAANREYFWKLGGYDRQFMYWGTENLELSFRIWQCGGSLECSPCSRVFHIFRKGGSGYSSPPNALTINKMRTAAIWMDEFGDLARAVLGRPTTDLGSLDEMRALRERLQCKSFKWFFDNVWPESYITELPRDVPFMGEIKNRASNRCVDSMGRNSPGQKIGIVECHGMRGPQEFMYFRVPKHIMPVRNDEACLKPPNELVWCHEHQNMWEYSEEDGLLHYLDRGRPHDPPQCLAERLDARAMELKECDAHDPTQVWSFERYKTEEEIKAERVAKNQVGHKLRKTIK